MAISPVFNETYDYYCNELKKIDIQAAALMLGAEYIDNKAIIPFFGIPYTVSADGLKNPHNKKPSFEISVVLFKYFLLCPKFKPVQKDLAAFKDFKDSGPLTVFWTTDVEKPVERKFAGKKNELETRAITLGAKAVNQDIPWDMALKFTALPRIPIFLLFNDKDDEFKAKCSVLFEKSAEKYLDGESLAVLGAVLSRNITAGGNRLEG